MTGKVESRQIEVAEFSRDVKLLAKIWKRRGNTKSLVRQSIARNHRGE
jgi:hypothetical protein